jgi:hypothetical protein
MEKMMDSFQVEGVGREAERASEIETSA